MGDSSYGVDLPRLKLAAVALGATGILGFTYWYLRRSAKSKNSLSNSNKTVSIDDAGETTAPEDLSPLQQAQDCKKHGNDAFKKGKYDEAIVWYNKAIEACPKESSLDLATFYQNRAAAYEQLKKWTSVINDCTTALDYNGKYEKALSRRARAYELMKDWELALDDITAVCLIQGFRNQNTLLLADRVLKELGKEHAAEAMSTRKPKLCSKQFIKTYFMSFPSDPVYQKLLAVDDTLGQGELKGFLKAKLAFATEQYDDIIPSCTDEINNSESESDYISEALSLRGTFYALSGSYIKSMLDFKTLIDTEEVDSRIRVNALIKSGSLNMQLNNVEECLKDFEKAALLGPEIPEVYHHRGQIYLLTDKTEEARDDFRRAVLLKPDYEIAVIQSCYADYRYASMTQNVDLLMETMATFRKSLERFPTCSEAYVLYAQVLAERHDYKEAKKLYEKALEIDPKNGSIYVHRGILELQWNGDVEKGVEIIKKAMEVDPKCEFAYETLGTVEVQRGNLLVAIDYFDKAIELAKTEMEMTHLFSLRDAAISQQKISTKLGISSQLLKLSV